MSPDQIPFGSMMMQLTPYLITFVVAGFFMVAGFLMVIYPLLKNQIFCYFSIDKKNISLSSKNLTPALEL